MQSPLLTDECFKISRVISGESEITLRAEHLPSGLSIERTARFAEESSQRRSLRAELMAAVLARYPEGDFVIEHLWLGPGKGASLVLRHLPSGLSAGRSVGYERQAPALHQLFAELIRSIRVREAP